MLIFTLLSVTTSAIFSGVIFGQYRARRKPYQLVWGIALGMFALATASELCARIAGWSPLLIRGYYLFGATLVVGYLALGTVYLMGKPALSRIGLGALLALTVLATISIARAPIDMDALSEGYRAMQRPPLLRAISVTLNAVGTLIVVGGALQSAWVFARKRLMPHRAQANALIALGVLVVASGGTLTGQLGFSPTAITVANSIGVATMFLGVLQADRQPATKTAAASA